jgi:hypothetical protein
MSSTQVQQFRSHKFEVVALFAAIALLHVVGFGALLLIVAPHHYRVGAQIVVLGLGSRPTRLGCGTLSTPTTSPPSTTRPANSWPTGRNRRRWDSGLRWATR